MLAWLGGKRRLVNGAKCAQPRTPHSNKSADQHPNKRAKKGETLSAPSASSNCYVHQSKAIHSLDLVTCNRQHITSTATRPALGVLPAEQQLELQHPTRICVAIDDGPAGQQEAQPIAQPLTPCSGSKQQQLHKPNWSSPWAVSSTKISTEIAATHARANKQPSSPAHGGAAGAPNNRGSCATHRHLFQKQNGTSLDTLYLKGTVSL